jgi:hypothetical protein
MTLSEFKAWFEGFSEGIDKAPTEKQFAKIKAKVADIDGAPVSYPVFVHRYWNQYRHWSDQVWSNVDPYPTIVTLSGTSIARFDAGSALPSEFDSHSAMRELGREDAVN